ncbi:MAG: phenylalanine--tRNA ligase subunit beta [Aureliella sp.]
MLVCWEWLSQYTELNVEADDLANQFAMSGLNHEGTETVGADTVLDLEVTSNRGDCLGHIGVAREAAVLLGGELKIPPASPSVVADAASNAITVENDFPDACPLYTARVMRGVKVGPSPEWLVRRLAAIGISSVNNVVDATNYVMMECGQPLHAFDLSKIEGKKIIVRPANAKEKLVAIDHRTYELDEQMVVIADSAKSVALGGVMGGAESEVGETTTDLLIEAATFNPLPIRRAARKLKLHSPSSFRFERRPDPAGLDWASRRCCELIAEVAGGEILSGCVQAGSEPAERETVQLRRGQIPRILGIEVPAKRTDEILEQLGCKIAQSTDTEIVVQPPSWRGDLTREVDLIEEVARIYGYEQIPEDVNVPMTVAARRPKDIAMQRVRQVLSAAGIDEAMTPSVVGDDLEKTASVWTEHSPLATDTPLLLGAKLLRRSVLPSLLAAKYNNQAQSIRDVQLYELATIYLPTGKAGELPTEQSTLGIQTTADLQSLRGIVEEIIGQVCPRDIAVRWELHPHEFFVDGSSLKITVDGAVFGFLGLVSQKVQDAFNLDQPVAGAELNVDVLSRNLEEVRTTLNVSPFPAISRDLNFVVPEQCLWADLSEACHAAGGDLLQRVDYVETYRNAKKDGDDHKRILLSATFQSMDRTLTGTEVDQAVDSIVANCLNKLSAKLLG